jgi:hypothetical protein
MCVRSNLRDRCACTIQCLIEVTHPLINYIYFFGAPSKHFLDLKLAWVLGIFDSTHVYYVRTTRVCINRFRLASCGQLWRGVHGLCHVNSLSMTARRRWPLWLMHDLRKMLLLKHACLHELHSANCSTCMHVNVFVVCRAQHFLKTCSLSDTNYHAWNETCVLSGARNNCIFTDSNTELIH